VQGLLAKMLCAYIVDWTVVFCFFIIAGGSTASECYWQFASVCAEDAVPVLGLLANFRRRWFVLTLLI
jgi:hypothetical protein